LDKFLQDIGETGESSEFSIDPERASKLLTQAWTSRTPRLVYPLHLLASAVGSGATKFEFSRRPSLGVYLGNLLFRDRWEFVAEHDGEPPSSEALQKLREMLSVSCEPQIRSLALACQVAQTLYKARVSVEAGRGDTLDRLLVKNGVWKFSGGLKASRPFQSVKFRVEFGQGSFLQDRVASGWIESEFATGVKSTSFDADQELKTIQKSGLFAPIEMTWRGVDAFEKERGAYWESGPANGIYTDLTPRRPSPYDFSLQIAVGAHSGGWTFVRHGVILKSDILATLGRIQLVVSSGLFRTDAGGLALVVDEYVETVMKKCQELLGIWLSELDFSQSSERELVKTILSENQLYETLPQLYRLPVFETLDGSRLNAKEALEKGQDSPDSFSRSELATVVQIWAWDCPRYEFGQGFLPISRVWGDGRFLLCQAEPIPSQGILDCESQEFKEFGMIDYVLIPGTTSLFTCDNFAVHIRDMSDRQEQLWVDHGGVFESPVLSATPEFGLVLSAGVLHKWSLQLREFVKKVTLDGDFSYLEYWYEGVVLIEGQSEWGLFDTRRDVWLLRELRVEADFERTPHLKSDGSMAVEEYPQKSEQGEARIRFYRLEGHRLIALKTSWGKWDGLDLEFLGRRLGEAPGKLYFRENGCLWCSTPDSEPTLIARNDGARDVVLRSEYLAWATGAGCYVLSRDSGALAFHQDTALIADCLVKRDSEYRLGFGGKLLNPLTADEAAEVSLVQPHSCPDHLALWSDGEGHTLLCDPSNGQILVKCPGQSGEYWLNESWIVRYTEQWTVRAACGGDWSRIVLPTIGKQTKVVLWGEYVVFEETSQGAISLYRLPEGGLNRTIPGKLLGLSPDCESLAYLRKGSIILHELSQDVVHEFDKDEDNAMSAEYFLKDVHGSARFLDATRFAHPWIGVVKREHADWNLIKPHWMESHEIRVEGELMCLCNLGRVVFFDFQTASILATLHADGREWFFYTPLGLYDCSENGESLLRSDVDFTAIKKFRRNGLMKSILGNSAEPSSSLNLH